MRRLAFFLCACEVTASSFLYLLRALGRVGDACAKRPLVACVMGCRRHFRHVVLYFIPFCAVITVVYSCF